MIIHSMQENSRNRLNFCRQKPIKLRSSFCLRYNSMIEFTFCDQLRRCLRGVSAFKVSGNDRAFKSAQVVDGMNSRAMGFSW